MGMERVTSIMQSKVSNYATDVFGELAASCHEAGSQALTYVLQVIVSKIVYNLPGKRSSSGVRCGAISALASG